MPRNHALTVPQQLGSELAESRLGSYRLISQLARGGTASVYLAEHLVTGKRVALKLLDPSYVRRSELVEQFLQEHEIAASVAHTGLVEVYGSFTSTSGVPYLVMELLEGENLARLVDRDQVAIEAIHSIGMQAAAALNALHRAGYIHCDIKPDNVFVLYDETTHGWPRIKVIDYGVSRSIDKPGHDDGTISGTPAYMPPEQWHAEPSTKSDVYALGCMLYELLTGDQPFYGSLPQLMIKHSEELPPRPSSIRSDTPPALDSLIMRMLAKDTAMRPTMAEVEITLVALSHHIRAIAEDIEDAIAS